jgi:MFS superfamily sulfate permease-like transporter
LNNNDRPSGGENQKKSAQQMKQLSKKLSQMQMNMQQQMINANIDDLRNILDDLIKISYKQEELISDFKHVRQADPRFVELSQDQLKLQRDVMVLDDSLTSLANQIPGISSFVTRELSEMNRSVSSAILELKERNRSRALTHQQYAMTSMNNLALLLDDVLQQMQASGSGGSGGKEKDGEFPTLKEMQQQLSKQIEDLKKSGLQGRQLSEELARLAANQEMIRNELRKLQEELNGQMGNGEVEDNLGRAIKEMEKNEIDLVNKRLTQQLINRQELIMTRMLAAEDAMREQKLDDQRKGETAGDYDQRLPKAFEDYLKAKEKEIELLKTVPLDLHPFYKKEVTEYFRRLSSDN